MGLVPPASDATNVGAEASSRAALWSVVAAFGAYFCMYAFRKPFTAATFDGEYAGVGFKSLLVTSQVIGYAASKFLGIRIVAQTPWEKRVPRLLALIAFSAAGLLVFAVLPRPWSAVGLFLNGLALGMVFGMVIGFLEGRRVTEALSAGLCASFILADGVTKSIGTWLLGMGVTEAWMPFTAGTIFIVPLCVFAAMLARIPRPDAADVVARAPRHTMDARDRIAFVRRYGPGLGAVIIMYLMMTLLRSLRADFQPELYREMGQTVAANVFTRTETIVMLGILLVNGLCSLIRDNRTAFRASLLTCAAGIAIIVVALVGWRNGWLAGVSFITLIGLGMYLPYVAVHTTVFERLLALTRDRGNLGFLMYLADAAGYLGYGVFLLARAMFGRGEILPQFLNLCAACAAISTVALFIVWRYFSAERVTSMPSLAREEPA